MTITPTFTKDSIIINGHSYDRALVEKIILQGSDPAIENIVFDGFSGVGGVTDGFSRLPNWMVIACINHWDVAIETHQKNHPDCLHLLEDFKVADLGIIKYIKDEIRKRNPSVKFHVWLSLECTNFSNALGGKSRDADSRTLADHADRYVIELDPDILWIENVKEFKLWGPMIPKVVFKEKGKNKKVIVPQNIDELEYYHLLIASGKEIMCPLDVKKPTKKKLKSGEPWGVFPWMIPCPYRKGQDFKRWKAYITSLGYDADMRLFNCADYGVPQHRIRLIMQFNRKGVQAMWPEKTHDKHGKDGLPKWKPVRDCLDLQDEGDSVLAFIKEKGVMVPRIESDATIDRLINGCDKWVFGTTGEFIVKYLSNDKDTGTNSGASVDSASPTVTTQNRLGIAKAHMIDHYFGQGYTKPVSEPAGVSGTKDGISLHSVQYLLNYNHSSDSNGIEDVSPAVVAADKLGIVQAHFMDLQYSSGQRDKSIDEPCAAVTGVPKSQVVHVEHLIMDTQYNHGCKTLNETIGTITANRKHYYLVNFQWFNKSFNSIDNPSNTIIARMDKAPNYLITLETGELAIEVFENDPPHYIRLKKYMAENGIIAINMRMLKDIELLKIMTMNPATKLSKSSTANKKMIGNAVPSDFVRQLGAALNNKDFNTIAA